MIELVSRAVTASSSGRGFAVVYLTTSPNPTSGHMQILQVESLISTDPTPDDTMHFIITGNTGAPDRIDFGAAFAGLR